MEIKNLALLITFIVLFVRYIKAIVKRVRSYDDRIISKKSKRWQCTGFIAACIAVSIYSLFKDNGYLFYNIKAGVEKFYSEASFMNVLSLWGWYFIYSIIGGIIFGILMSYIFNLREIKDLEVLKTYYIAYDYLQSERKNFKGLENEAEMNMHIDNALVELDKLVENKREHVRLISVRHILFELIVPRVSSLNEQLREIETNQQQIIRKYTDEISKIELPENVARILS